MSSRARGLSTKERGKTIMTEINQEQRDQIVAEEKAKADAKKKKGCSIGCAVVAGLFIIIAAMSGGNDTSKSPAPAPQQAASAPAPSEPAAISISAVQLYKEYDSNGVAADKKYKDKLLAVTGAVDSIDKDILDTPYVTLRTQSFGSGLYSAEVQCMFEENHDALANLSKGQTVTIVGKCNGNSLINVILENCQLQ